MDNLSINTGGFTLPGEAGYEDLTLRLAEKWGADVIRDSDGTQLSDKITESPYDIYSTVCLVRADNQWAKANPSKLQQCCIMSQPVFAEGNTVTIDLLKGYFTEQMVINSDDDPKQWWQVFDRTSGEEIPTDRWSFDKSTGSVTIREVTAWHKYTVNFFAYRIWEEISMYNHVTNDWGNKEHLMPIDPIHPEAREQILTYLENWLDTHPDTKVVRLTSMFYNFWWFWGDGKQQRFLVNDWGSYEFSVSTEAIRQFEKQKGYRPCSEDFVNAGLYNNSYKVPSPFYKDWIDFVCAFVVDFGSECIERIHARGKQAFVFYNDHWIGIEPFGKRFKDFGFDGIIDGIFNGFEARKVAETPDVDVREIRMHPYLFPTGVNGAPSFLPGGNPTLECKTYWLDIRRALLRKPVDRIGFGGYLHLVENHPDFIDYIEQLGHEFRQLRNLVKSEAPWENGIKVAILSAWGKLRAWGCRGHFNRGNYYNEVMESLSGMPVDTTFISFDDILENGIPADVDVIINAGLVDDSWSGGEHWRNPTIIEKISQFVYEGGAFLGIGEPSAQRHSTQYFQLCHLLGVDREIGLTQAFDRLPFQVQEQHPVINGVNLAGRSGNTVGNLYLADAETQVLSAVGKSPSIVVKTVGSGRTAYLAGFQYSTQESRLLSQALNWLSKKDEQAQIWFCENAHTECAWFPAQRKLVVINNTAQAQSTKVYTDGEPIMVQLEPYACQILEL